MANVWKIGSKWGRNYLIDIFKEKQLVFVGNAEGKLVNGIQAGNYIAIARGHTIIAVAKASENGKFLTEKDINIIGKNEEEMPISIKLKDKFFYKHAEGGTL